MSTLSRIESLPAELLQRIFLLSYSVSFARSSPYIGSKLCSQYIFSTFTDAVLFYGASDKLARPPARSDYQHWVLDTSADVSEYLTASAEAKAHGFMFVVPRGIYYDIDTDLADQLFSCRWFRWTEYKAYLMRVVHRTGLRCFENAAEFTGPDYFDDPVQPHAEGQLMPFKSHLGIFRNGRIPRKLLRGPWGKDKCVFLYFLVCVGFWPNLNDRHELKAGLKESIQEGAGKAVVTLLGFDKIDGVDVWNVSYLDEMLSYSVICCGCDRTVTRALIQSRYSRRMEYGGVYKPELIRWAVMAENTSDPKGPWLKKRIYEANKGRLTIPIWLSQQGGKWCYSYTDEYQRPGDVCEAIYPADFV